MARDFAAGDVLAQKFRLVSQLGAGGMGSVWRADHLVLKSPVAIKLIHDRVASAPGAIDRFLREAQAAAAIRSPHVIQVLDYGVEGSTPYLVMELLEGESLAARLKRLGRLAPEETSRIVSHVARALARAHEAGVVHRDLKPDNVFLVHNQDEELAKVLDFGIAKTLATSDATTDAGSALTQTGAVLGTPHYMSPEQARGRSDVDHRSDVWALGVIAFQCMTGRRPFDSPILGDLLLKICADPVPSAAAIAGVPAGFDPWLERALARDPQQRFQSAVEMADALRALVGGTGPVAVLAHAPIHSLPAPPKSSSAPLWIAVGAGGLLIVLGVLGVGAAFIFGGFGAFEASPALSASAPSIAVATEATAEPTLAPPGSSSAAATPIPKSTRPTGSGVAATAPTATATPTATTTPTAPAASDVCQRACARLQSCGQPCKFKSACDGAYKALANCINGKKTCLDILECG